MAWTTVGFKRMCLDWMKDPQRRKHVLWRSVQCLVGWIVAMNIFMCATGTWGYWKMGLLSGLISVAANFAVFEFVLEPLGLLGPYWEGGPEDGRPYKLW